MKKFYAEWTKQDGILLAFPHQDSDWREYLAEVREVYCQIIYEIIQIQSCLVLCQNKEEVKQIIKSYAKNSQWNLKYLKNLYLIEIPTNDTWARDFGGITINYQGQNLVLDYGFNGWGLKFAANYDNNITKQLHKLGIFKQIKTKKIILEGGSIESNGEGIILTNTQCLLESNRNPAYSQNKIEKILKKDFGAKKILWLNYGYLAGDDTDSHIDTLARFIDKNTIAYLKCEDKNDEHYQALAKMEKELKKLKNLNQKPFKLVSLPFCEAKYFHNERLPATYANFLFLNGAVLLPIYRDKNDNKAIKILQKALPKHKIIPIDCSVLIRQHGSLHCISMQFPKGTLNYEALKKFQ
ncbi:MULTISPECIES: agmatine deiminase family protein [Helicobacter]|uniref:agmatine deiminase family protein n=1 Tax=Helicobacter TaxID=209 RepID=UPI002029F285|nr:MULTISPECIES: agmatine deiminase family protein [Helicobacter]MCI7047121.1 agmatine deiminase family protein [Helicobacter sp.]MCL9822166.1 agmatine deiminase family protein [Helicobacter colisuis]MDY4427209.1 agmatine deiminase family protein [Helicobacter sp.]MDY5616599.1 agmatine deiminase family protein [Helicobacter sp.]